jgi:oligopeptide transport system substrate-binding protein
MKLSKWIIVPVTLLLLAGCNLIGPRPEDGGSPTPGGVGPTVTLMPAPAQPEATGTPESVIATVNLGRPPGTIDPALVAPPNVDPAGNDLVENLFVGLTTLDPDTGQVTPGLAKSWEAAAGELTWILYLRDDVFWVSINTETGQMERERAVTAEDVVFAMQRACRPDTGAPLAQAAFVIKGCREVNEADLSTLTPEFVEGTLGARVLNDVTVELKLESNEAVLPSVLAMTVLRPVPITLFEAAGDSWTDPDLIWTSGPYAVQPTIPPEEGYTLIANQFWPEAKSGNVDVVQISFAEDPAEAFGAWQEGRLDLTVLPGEEMAAAPFEDDPAYRRLVQQAVAMIVFSYDTPPFDRPGVRRALSLALDRERIIAGALADSGVTGIAARTLTPPGAAAAPPYGEVGVSYDPDAARAALSDGGYPGCQGFPQVTLLTGEAHLSGALAEAYVESWVETLGCSPQAFAIEQQPLRTVQTTLHEPPSGSWQSRPGLITLGWQADYVDAQHWLADIIGCRDLFPDAYLNQSRACVEADNWLVEAMMTWDMDARSAFYVSIDEAFFGPGGEMPVIPVYFHARGVVIQPWVEVYPLHTGALRFDRWVVDRE